jgi:hypothetical protein
MTDDASAMFWNPARLNQIENFSLFLSHSEYLADMSFESFGFAKNVAGIGVIGLNLIYLDSGPIEETTIEFQSGTGKTFSALSYAVGLSYARKLTDRFSIGFNFRYVNEDLTNGLAGADNATGAWAIDAGTVYYPRFKNLESLRLSMSIRNFGPETRLQGTYVDFDGNQGEFLDENSEFSLFPLPLMFQFGIGYDPIETQMHKLSLAIIGEHPNDNLERLNLGAEYMFNNLIALRGGYVLNHDTRTFSAGVGTLLNIIGDTALRVDYGYAHFRVLEDVQHISLSFNW